MSGLDRVESLISSMEVDNISYQEGSYINPTAYQRLVQVHMLMYALSYIHVHHQLTKWTSLYTLQHALFTHSLFMYYIINPYYNDINEVLQFYILQLYL